MYDNNSKWPGGEKWKYTIVNFLSVPGTWDKRKNVCPYSRGLMYILMINIFPEHKLKIWNILSLNIYLYQQQNFFKFYFPGFNGSKLIDNIFEI